jgi:hypothetical protein
VKRTALVAWLCLGCSAAAPPPQAVVPEVVPDEPVRTLSALPPLSAEERSVQTELDSELGAFLALGARAFDDQGLGLASATDHIATRLEALGYEVRRRGFANGERVAQNLEVEVPGLRRGNQVVVVSARIDANPGSPGADDNASGVAAALVLARHFLGQRALRTVRFVFLSSAGPRSEAQAQGAFHYAQALEQEVQASQSSADEASEDESAVETAGPREILAVVDLDGIGVFADTPGSQRYPAAVISSNDRGDFIALVSQPETTQLAAVVGDSFQANSSLPYTHWVLLPEDAWLAGTAARAFLDRGFPTLQLTDTRELRFNEFGGDEDQATALDSARMARVVTALDKALQRLAGPRGQAPEPNPEGLTPTAAPNP